MFQCKQRILPFIKYTQVRSKWTYNLSKHSQCSFIYNSHCVVLKCKNMRILKLGLTVMPVSLG